MMLTCFADTQVKGDQGEGRWRDGDIRRHGEGADKVTTTLVYGVHWAQSTVHNWQFATSPDYDAENQQPARNISV